MVSRKLERGARHVLDQLLTFCLIRGSNTEHVNHCANKKIEKRKEFVCFLELCYLCVSHTCKKLVKPMVFNTFHDNDDADVHFIQELHWFGRVNGFCTPKSSSHHHHPIMIIIITS